MKKIKQFLIGFFVPMIIVWTGLLLLSAVIGFFNWENPLQFFGDIISDGVEDGIGVTIRKGIIISLITGVLSIFIHKYLEDD